MVLWLSWCYVGKNVNKCVVLFLHFLWLLAHTAKEKFGIWNMERRAWGKEKSQTEYSTEYHNSSIQRNLYQFANKFLIRDPHRNPISVWDSQYDRVMCPTARTGLKWLNSHAVCLAMKLFTSSGLYGKPFFKFLAAYCLLWGGRGEIS